MSAFKNIYRYMMFLNHLILISCNRGSTWCFRVARIDTKEWDEMPHLQHRKRNTHTDKRTHKLVFLPHHLPGSYENKINKAPFHRHSVCNWEVKWPRAIKYIDPRIRQTWLWISSLQLCKVALARLPTTLTRGSNEIMHVKFSMQSLVTLND